MSTKHLRIAKISKPDSSAAFPRKRVFRLLDDCRRKPIVWISGPAGSGKTTLAASYLKERELPCLWYQTDEGDADLSTFFYYLGLAAKDLSRRKPLPHLTSEYAQAASVFTRRYFEELFRRCKPPFALVFDNYQELSQTSSLHEMIAPCLDIIPEGINVVVISRTNPPPAFARLRANNKIAVIGWNEIRFTIDESAEFFSQKSSRKIPAERVVEVHEKTEGWAAGLLLMASAFVLNWLDMQSWDVSTPQEIFDYFMSEIFDKTETATQKFLLMTSFLPCITVETARKLTDNSSAHSILSILSSRHYFIDWRPLPEPVYQYHPLFREFLLARAKEALSRDELKEISCRAAVLLAEEGRTEHAAALFIDTEDWEGLTGLILGTAKSLVEQGRTKPLRDWIVRIPGEIIENRPWLLYWLGICRLSFDPSESRRYFEKAFDRFKTSADASGAFLSWAGIADSFIYELGDFSRADRWISEVDSLLRRYPQFPGPEIEARVAHALFCMLMFRQPDHPDLPRWEEKLKKIALRSTDLRLRIIISAHLVLYYTWWTGEQSKASSLIETVGPAVNPAKVDPLTQIVWRAFGAAHNWMTARNEECLSSVRLGLEAAEKAGVHIWDFVLLAQATWAMTAEEFKSIQSHLRRMEFVTSTNRRIDIFYYRYLLGWEALYKGDLHRAHEHMNTALIMVKETGIAAPFGVACTLTGLAEVLIESGRYDEAEKHLRTARQLGRRMRSKPVEHQFLRVMALLCFKRGDITSGLANLRNHFAVSREYGILHHMFWRPSVMADLYARALESGIEVDHVRSLIWKHKVVPDAPHVGQEWPYPVKIYTLGAFIIFRDGEEAQFGNKIQQKPLTMLKALIALGDQGVSEKNLIDVLWPDADGASAHKSHEMTLLRLRKLLGKEGAVQFRGGKVSLDPRFTWVDAHGFEEISRKAVDAWSAAEKKREVSGPETAEAVRLTETALGIYKGNFLADDSDQPWTVSMREKLKDKYTHLVLVLSRHWEAVGRWDKAVDHLQRGLEIYNLSEEFYRDLMICYERLGRKAEAAKVYERCRSVFSRALGITPSARTEALYRRIRR